MNFSSRATCSMTARRVNSMRRATPRRGALGGVISTVVPGLVITTRSVPPSIVFNRGPYHALPEEGLLQGLVLRRRKDYGLLRFGNAAPQQRDAVRFFKMLDDVAKEDQGVARHPAHDPPRIPDEDFVI